MDERAIDGGWTGVSPAGEAEVKKVKRTRKGVKKTKTGCFTCRVRHTKCDETKPSCKRCTDTGRTCDFLVPALAYTTKPKPPKRSTVVQKAAKTPTTSPSNSESDRPIIILPKISQRLNLLPLMNADEVSNFDYFRNVCAKDLSGYFKVNLWDKFILQTAQQEPCIRHAIVALGSLHRSQLYPSDLWQTVTTLEYSTAYYDKAIKTLNDRLDDCSMSWELAILSSLLFVALELLLGHEMNAVMHLKSGLSMLRAIRARFAPKFPVDVLPTVECIKEMPPCPLSGNLHDMVSAFSRLDVQAASFENSYDPNNFRSRIIPSSFPSIIHARDTLNSILSAMYSFLHRHRELTEKTLPYSPLSKSVTMEIEDLKSLLVNWSTLFKPFINTENASTNDRAAVNTLIIQRIAAWIHISTFFHGDQLCYDFFYPRFARMVELAQDIVDGNAQNYDDPAHIDPRSRFSIDVGIIQPLLYVAAHCRDPVLRRRAIAVMDGLGREGVYDGVSCAAVARWIVDKEEEGIIVLADGSIFVPGEMRLWDGVTLEFDRVKRKCHIMGIRRNEDEIWEHVSGHVRWTSASSPNNTPPNSSGKGMMDWTCSDIRKFF